MTNLYGLVFFVAKKWFLSQPGDTCKCNSWIFVTVSYFFVSMFGFYWSSPQHLRHQVSPLTIRRHLLQLNLEDLIRRSWWDQTLSLMLNSTYFHRQLIFLNILCYRNFLFQSQWFVMFGFYWSSPQHLRHQVSPLTIRRHLLQLNLEDLIRRSWWDQTLSLMLNSTYFHRQLIFLNILCYRNFCFKVNV